MAKRNDLVFLPGDFAKGGELVHKVELVGRALDELTARYVSEFRVILKSPKRTI